MPLSPSLQVRILTDAPYAEVLKLQQDTVRIMRDNPDYPQTLLCVEHRPAVTLGRTADRAHLRVSPAELQARGIDCIATSRGGDVTYHGPGQWTLYPLLRLKVFCQDLHRYLRMLEETVIIYLRDHGIAAGRREINSGVWVGRDKIAAVGVACSAWISWHGIAVNIQPNLNDFKELIIPCGIAEKDGGVTSLSRETGRSYAMDAELQRLLQAFTAVFPFSLP